MKKTWFITGASRGFGRIWAEAALMRGDQVTATARKLADVADLAERFGDALLPLALDVTNSAQVQQVVEQAHRRFGRLDVLVNNAGASLLAATEEASDASAAATRQRSHPWRLQRPWNYVVASHRLLLRHEVGS